MNERVRREALRAAAKVALALTPLAACGGATMGASVDGDRAPAHPDRGEDALVLDDGGATSRRADAVDAALPVTVTDASSPDSADSEVETCAALLDSSALVSDAGFGATYPITADTTACCETTLKAYVASFSDPDASFDDEYVPGCCALEWTLEPDYEKQPQWVHMACSPWGPPMPPAMVA